MALRSRRAREAVAALAAGELRALVDPTIVDDVIAILSDWDRRWHAEPAARTLLEMPSLLHEVEESIVAMHALFARLPLLPDCEPLTVVDLCAGKAIFSTLLSYVASRRPAGRARVRAILAAERRTASAVNFWHVRAANADVERGGAAEAPEEAIRAAIPIELMEGCNIHEAAIEERLRSQAGRVVVLGIHLCRTLSPRAVGLFNALGLAKSPLLLLAPCCLPRTTGPPIRVALFESEAERTARLAVAARRQNTAKGATRRCWLCRSEAHIFATCPEEAAVRFRSTGEEDAALVAASPCWRCGEPGHKRSECTAAGRPPAPRGAAHALDVVSVGTSTDPWEAWCAALRGAVQAAAAESELWTVPLRGRGAGCAHEANWNRHRKCTWLICVRCVVPPSEAICLECTQ